MKQNWWKLLVVVALIIAVGVVLAGKNRNSDEKIAVATDSSVDKPVNEAVEQQSQEDTKVDVQEPEKQVHATVKTEDNKPDAVAKTGANSPTPEIDEKSKNETTVKPVVKKPEQPKPVVKPEQPTATPKKLPKMIELGSATCVPCKMMKPIVEELQKNYKGKLEVVFIDVNKDNTASEKYSIQSIPTQIFFDENGKEFYRHVGFFAKGDILAKFEDHGIKLK